MSKADEKKLEQMLVDFEKTHPDSGKNFRTLLGETPALRANLLNAIGKGNLEKIEQMPAGAPAGALGAYSAADKAMLLPTALLDVADKDKKLANTMRMVLTHESEHAVNKQAIEKADKAFEGKLTAIAKGPSPHDYTKVISEKGTSDRLREATDQIGGFNAVAAHVHKQNPAATKEQLYKLLHDSSPEMEPYFDVGGTPPKQTYAPKTGLTLDKDGQLAKTPANIEAMGKHFYDARPYKQIYGVEALQTAMQIEFKEQAADRAADPKYKAPEVRVNLKELGLDGAVTIPPGIGITDTSPKAPIPFLPDRMCSFGMVPELYLQSVTALEKLGPDAGIKNRDELGNVAAAMASKAQTDGLQKIDSVVPSTDGKGLIATQGDPGSAHAKNSYIDRADAAQQSPEKNLEQLRQNPPTVEIAAPQLAQTGPSR
jgi:uncharacterized lipoprotein NlpE involved in copper resistance